MKHITNPKILLIGCASLVLLIAGYFFLSPKKDNTAPNTVTSENQTETTKTNGVNTSIQDLLSSSVSLRCAYTDSTGDQVVTYIKNGAIRSHSLDPVGKEEGDAIVKNGMVYVWEKERGESFKMTFDPNHDYKQNDDPNSYSSLSGTDFIKQLENFQSSCIPTTVSDTLFELPPGVSFVDYSVIFEKTRNSQAP